MLADVSHLNLPACGVARRVRHNPALERLDRDRLDRAANFHLRPVRLGDRETRGEEGGREPPALMHAHDCARTDARLLARIVPARYEEDLCQDSDPIFRGSQVDSFPFGPVHLVALWRGISSSF